MLIESYKLEITVATHSTEHFEYEAIAHLDVDIRDALPYLNATLSRALYVPARPSLAWRYETHNVGFWPDRIAVDDLESREQAQEMIDYLVALVNQTWEKRDQIEPDNSTHPRRQPLECYRLLPRTNCKLCGEETCFNFALKLTTDQVELGRCSPLYEDPTLEEQRTQLEALLIAKWPTL